MTHTDVEMIKDLAAFHNIDVAVTTVGGHMAIMLDHKWATADADRAHDAIKRLGRDKTTTE